MTSLKPQSKWSAFKKLLLALPLLAVLVASAPNAQADDHRHGRNRHERRDYRRGRHHGRYYHEGRYYGSRRYYYRDGRRYYRYYDVDPGGISVNIGL